MHALSRLLVAVFLMMPFSSALIVPDSAPDLLLDSDNVIPPPINAAADIPGEAAQVEQSQHQEKEQNTVIKVLVCGDSITQGLQGQFTWRYRLWEWFQADSKSHALTATQPETPSTSQTQSSTTTTTIDHQQDPHNQTSIRFVGPYNGTLPISSTKTTNKTIAAWGADPTNPQTWGTYHPAVDPSFHPGGGSAHFAVYGRPAWMDIDLIGAQVQAHQPDFVVLHLGFNDIGWWGNGAADLVGTMQRLVFYSRLARADVAVLIADVSHRLAVAGREDIAVTTAEYNRMIVGKAREWSTEVSPVEVVRVSEVYDCHVESCPAGSDGLHPNALGDYQIARAYAQVFHDRFGIGPGALEVPAENTIPGMSTYSGAVSNVMGVISSAPPLGIFASIMLLGLVLTMVLRPELLRLKRLGKAKYHLLPSR